MATASPLVQVPHLFEPMNTLTPSWCCHCGIMLPLGCWQQPCRCTECSTTAHADFTHLLPYFFGMSMEMAIRLLQEIKTSWSPQSNRISAIAPAKPTSNSGHSVQLEVSRLQLGTNAP
ncbi:hypothetical protein BY996DRAFT_8468561 [Phakopsora pachyrhizi]|uniref:Phorbol-ester/DAG-type domain-containing protein n=1 Tax=Phakopsora pachyrhizi TaxID=170000 RepID=A0AAV0B0G0_PHAPC|nr:hypothetical protein BY996DRAFT_8521907 [Phakopsora pachyrhizi]KAI8455163.1 hypothetical protein BY996DRAFT_8468561 [Phakopsora pachyrhizi]CAH7676236.1 hypothetical protein PPACK8108_LOCUS11348 [Phakopsora pachyrhizi]